ncbi:hypothetical protein ACS0TY_019889 [Phlomoides rotata]
MGRAPCCEKKGLKRGPWTPEEDEKLVDYIKKHGHGSWRSLPKLADCVGQTISGPTLNAGPSPPTKRSL